MLREGTTFEAEAVQLDEREELAWEEFFIVSQALEKGSHGLHLRRVERRGSLLQ